MRTDRSAGCTAMHGSSGRQEGRGTGVCKQACASGVCTTGRKGNSVCKQACAQACASRRVRRRVQAGVCKQVCAV